MIRFKNETFEDYFIDPVTAVITDKDGNVVQTRLHGKYLVVKDEHEITGLPIHCIQAHTAYGYKEGYHVHHKDRNKLNNSLSNLLYLSKSEHIKLHRKEDPNNGGFSDQKGENNNMYGVKYKWINDGKICKFLFEGEMIPDGWSYGRIFTDEAKANILKAVKNHVPTEDTRAKISKANKGKKFTQEHKDKIRDALKGKMKGYHFYNNGIKNILAKECKEGFKKGRI